MEGLEVVSDRGDMIFQFKKIINFNSCRIINIIPKGHGKCSSFINKQDS